MSIEVKIIADSVSSFGARVTTMQLRYPRWIHSEFMTHRLFSRNASSSRAVPANKFIEQILEDPAMPIHWGQNKSGMQADTEIQHVGAAKDLWAGAAKNAVETVREMTNLGLHKQVCNRIIESFQHINVVVTATEWDNFFWLRLNKMAQPEIQELSRQMIRAMDASVPRQLAYGEWHLPYITEEERCAGIHSVADMRRWSVSRCARVSYLNHDQSMPNPYRDDELYGFLLDECHLSPFEHQATPMHQTYRDWRGEDGITHMDRHGDLWSGNFRYWIQHRQIPLEVLEAETLAVAAG